MTLLQVREAKNEHGNNFVRVISIDNSEIRGVLQDAFQGHPDDPRGYTEPYLYVLRIDTPLNEQVKINCSDVQSIVGLY